MIMVIWALGVARPIEKSDRVGQGRRLIIEGTVGLWRPAWPVCPAQS